MYHQPDKWLADGLGDFQVAPAGNSFLLFLPAFPLPLQLWKAEGLLTEDMACAWETGRMMNKTAGKIRNIHNFLQEICWSGCHEILDCTVFINKWKVCVVWCVWDQVWSRVFAHYKSELKLRFKNIHKSFEFDIKLISDLREQLFWLTFSNAQIFLNGMFNFIFIGFLDECYC